MIFQILALILLSSFYIAYFSKMIILRKQGIKGDLLGKGKKSKKANQIELILKLITWLGAIIQFVSAIFPKFIWSFNSILSVQIIGLVIGFLGVLFFVFSITVMRNNWRAGFDETQNTELVTTGIYKFSRNPAFVGFDFLYIGCAMMFPNIANIVVALLALVTFHIQILGEENFLNEHFGKAYEVYKSSVRRYL